MEFSSLKNLYRQVIMDHYKNPRNKGLIPSEAYYEIHLKNPTCGDDITVAVKVKDGKIEDIKHAGVGCSICCSSASVMSCTLKNKTIDEADLIIKNFYEIVKGNEYNESINMGDAVVYEGVSQFPVRIKCATIPWKALEQALEATTK